MTMTPEDEKLHKAARRRVKELKEFYSHAITFAIAFPFLVFINLFYSPHYWWFLWVLLGWGVFGLGSHAMKVLGRNVIFGKDWEERKIKEEMEKMKR